MLNFLFKKGLAPKEKWANVEYRISNKEGVTLTNKEINKSVNRFWLDHFKEINNEEKYLILMFRVRLTNDDIKTITKLQRLRFTSKEFLKSFLSLKSNIILEAYNDSPIKGIIFSWIVKDIKKLKKELIDTVVEELKPIESNSYTHSFKNVKDLPIDVNLNLFGKFLNNTKSFKSLVISKNRILNIEISKNPEGLEIRKFSLIKDGEIRLTWEDKITNADENSLIRTIGNTIIEFEDGAIVYKRIVIPLKRITKIKPSKKINNKIIAADLETVLKGKTMTPYLASFSSLKESKTFFLTNDDTKMLFSEFFKHLFTRKYKNFRIYFHNLSNFDGIFLLKRLVDLKYKIEPLIHSGKIIQIKVENNKTGLSFFINDSLLLMLQSLEKLAKNFIMQTEENKGIFPYYLNDLNYKGNFPSYDMFDNTKVSLKDYEKEAKNFVNLIWNFKIESTKYCLNDSILLRKVVNSFNNFIFNSFKIDITKYPTIPSLAFAIFRSKYLMSGEVGVIPVNTKIYNKIRLSYTGGSTDMFIPALDNKNIFDDYGNLIHIEDKKIYAYDINSLYPAVMRDNPYPIGDATYIEISEERRDLKMNLNLFGFFYAEIVAPNNLAYPILQLHHNNRTVSPVGYFNGWFFSEELKNALKFGYQIKLINGYTFEKGFIFKEWVNDLYNLRLTYPKTDPMNYISKILLNSLYGRFGMGELAGYSEVISKKEFSDLTDDDRVDILDTIDLGNNILVNYKDFPSLEDELGNNDILTNINIAIASAVTAYARIKMSKFKHPDFLEKLDLKLYYSDTDSLYFDGPLPDHFISPTELGKLKLEGIWDKALFLAPKVYALEKTNGRPRQIIKIKGLKKDALKGASLDQLIPLLQKGEKINFNQSKWLKSLDTATINILETNYLLRVTANKRELIYKNDLLVGTKPLKL